MIFKFFKPDFQDPVKSDVDSYLAGIVGLIEKLEVYKLAKS
jgi:hypothetical protein